MIAPTAVPRAFRLASAVVALVAAAAVAALLWHQVGVRQGDVAAAVWDDLGFFTDLGNLFTAIVFARIALGRWGAWGAYLLGQALAAILVVGIGYWTIGRGYLVFGTVGIGDVLAHGVTPVLAPLAWLVFAPKGRFRWHHAAAWMAFPAAYLGYALVRGAATGTYPYGWMNVTRLGLAGVLPTVAILIAMTFVIGLVLVLLDRLLARLARGR